MPCVRVSTLVIALAVPAVIAAGFALTHTPFAASHADAPAERTPRQVPAQAPPIARPGSSGDPASAARVAARALMAHKAELVAKCWTPLVAAQPEPPRSRHVLHETFDADGKETARTVDDLPGQSRADVGACLRALPLELQIEPADKPNTISITLAFP